jgi:hypothetical protein
MRHLLPKLLVLLIVALPVLAKAQGMGKKAPDEWEINVEGANDFRGAFDRTVMDLPSVVPVEGSEQSTFAPSIGISYMRRITNLRAYYGLRIEGYYADWDGTVDAFENATGDTYTAAALINYKAFLFDMEGDCDCPRWDKTNFFKKAFFVEFGAGYGRQSFSRDDFDESIDRSGVAYMARVGIAVRLKKQWDVYLAGGAHGLIASELFLGRHEVAVRPALGVTWRPFYSRI